ncbi:hypothetical protein CWS02_23365 [Enterobacter sp. EA-1]|nr:hypothetical protein CWS02_23365 [Enterobacter sp. EA-1]
MALITHVEQDKNQNVEGCLSLRLTIQFMVNEKEINAKRYYRQKLECRCISGRKRVTIRYSAYNPEKIVILGDVKN